MVQELWATQHPGKEEGRKTREEVIPITQIGNDGDMAQATGDKDEEDTDPKMFGWYL